MSVEADHSFLVPASSSAASDRSQAFERARKHSSLVRALRIAFPVCALLIVSFYFVFSSWSISVGDMKASVRRIEINKERLRMVDPKLEGETDNRGVYEVTADFAEQEIAKPSIVHLTAVRAEVNNSKKKSWTRLTAPQGVFDTTQEELVLTGAIKIKSSSGMVAHLTRADMDMRTQRAVSNEPVIVEALNGTINADTMEFLIKDRTVIFRENVRVHIYKRPPKKKDGEKSQ